MTLKVVCNCSYLQSLAVDVLTKLCCLNYSACGRRAQQRLLSTSRSSPRVVERSIISSVSVANRVTRLRTIPPAPPTGDRTRRRSFGNRDLLLGEKSNLVLNDDTTAGLPTPLESLDGKVENAIDGAKIVTKNHVFTKRTEDADDDDANDCGSDGKPSGESNVNWKRSDSKVKESGFQPLHTMLVVVTADVVAATAQIGEGDRGGGSAALTTATAQCDTLLPSDASNVGSNDVAAGLEVKSLSDGPQGTSSTMTEEISITAGQT